MAKGKHAAALFEVISAAKQKEMRSKSGGFALPKWWFKNKKKQRPAAAAPVDPTSGRIASAISHTTAPEIQPPAPVYDPPASSELMREEPIVAEAPAAPIASKIHSAPAEVEQAELEFEEPPAPYESVSYTSVPEKAARSRRPRGVDVAIDGFRQQIQLKLSYTSAAISACGLTAVVVVAFLFGKGLSHGPVQASASTIEQIRTQPPFPDVLNPAKTNTNVQSGTTVVSKAKPGDQKPQTPVQTPPTPPQSKAVLPQGMSPNGKRINGMQYVVIQSYPDPEDAKDAAEVLNKAGISVTVEKGLWVVPRWSSVVGVRGFDHTRNNPEYASYMKSIQDINLGVAATKKFKSFEPSPVGWKE